MSRRRGERDTETKDRQMDREQASTIDERTYGTKRIAFRFVLDAPCRILPFQEQIPKRRRMEHPEPEADCMGLIRWLRHYETLTNSAGERQPETQRCPGRMAVECWLTAVDGPLYKSGCWNHHENSTRFFPFKTCNLF